MNDITCVRCGSMNDYIISYSGPHNKATCNGCGWYIKFVPTADLSCLFKLSTVPAPVIRQHFMSMLKLQVIGHLGKDAEVKDVNGKKVINFSVAHTEKFKDAQGNTKEKTTWVECAKWGDQVAVGQYLKKGTQVYVEGQPEIRTWEGNGKSGVSLMCRVGLVQLLGSAPGTAAPAAATAAPGTPAPAAATESLDNLPF